MSQESEVPLGRVEIVAAFACPGCQQVLEDIDYETLVRKGVGRCPACYAPYRLAPLVRERLAEQAPLPEVRPLDCPACQGTLRAIPSRPMRIPLDRCDCCAGIWFDRDELDQTMQDPVVLGRLRIDEPQLSRATLKSERTCPRCSEVALQQGRLRSVTIDQCPACQGIWLDAGEIVSLSERKGPWEIVSTGDESPAGVWNRILTGLAEVFKR